MSEGFPTKFGRYTLTERLAVGGMAELFLAEVSGAHGFAKTVVIKRILPHLAADQQFTSMFISEAKITARLDHPKIAQTFDLGTEDEQLYIAMEYIDGLDVLALLRECAHRRVRVPPEIAVYIIKEVLDALDFAHKQTDDEGVSLGIVHRDVSPSNVLLSRRGDVKLVDFGIAHAVASDAKTQAGTLKGKYGYMSPEQVLGQPVDARSDLFSVGVVLAEMLMGRRLFAAPAELDVLLMVRDVDLSRLERFGKNIEPSLEELVRWALRKDPSDRFKDALAFREALDEWLFESRHRVTAKKVAEVVEALYADAQKRREEQAKQMPPPAVGTPDAGRKPVEQQRAAVASGSVQAAPPSAPPPPPGPSPASEVPAPGSPLDIELGPPGPPRPEDTSSGADAPGVDELVIEEVELELSEPAAAPVDDADTDVAVAEEALELGEDSVDLALDEAFSAPPADDGADEDAPGVDAEEEYSTSYPSISAAVAAVSPQDPDPASRDFDDSSVSGGAPADRRMPTADEIKRSKRAEPPAHEEITDTPARSGDLREEPALEVLWRLTAERASGLLQVSVGGIRKEIFFRRGVPEFVASNVAGELFGAYLVREGAISSAELDMALAVMPHFGGKLGDTLVGLGLMKPLEVFRHLTKQVRGKLVDVCTWSSGTYTWFANRKNPRTSFPLDLDPLEVYGAGAAALPAEHLEAWLERRGDTRPKAAESAKVVPELFQLGAITRRIQDSLDGRRTVRQIESESESEGQRLQTLRIVYLLMCTQLAVNVG